MAAVRELLQARASYEDTVWRTLKIMFDVSADIVPENRAELVKEEISTLNEMEVTAPVAAILIHDKDWSEDNGPSWAYLREVAREGGMPFFELVSTPTPMVSATQMEIVRKLCSALQLAGVSAGDATKHIMESLRSITEKLGKL
jgi:hypothetical protein